MRVMVIQDKIVFYSLILFILMLPGLLTIMLKPYKETLICSKTECTVNARFSNSA